MKLLANTYGEQPNPHLNKMLGEEALGCSSEEKVGNHWETGPVSISWLSGYLTALTLLYDIPKEEFLHNMSPRDVSGDYT